MEFTIRNFWDVFRQNPDGSLSPIIPIRIGGVTMGQGVSFGRGVSIGGIDFFQYMGKNMATTDEGGPGTARVIVIHGFYV